ncbi:DUF397 domain-containing protein [Streptomyces uncialis]|uniref:DUF397 domain-containing protein n=1 Tax=Streptomyces uncialis TaxID=1048205 RepID=UPI0036480A1E
MLTHTRALEPARQITWRRSSYSGDTGNNCVEIATLPHHIGIRDSKDVQGPVLAVAPTSWADFLSYVTATRT